MGLVPCRPASFSTVVATALVFVSCVSSPGPCPPAADDPHRYRFTVYALDEQLAAGDGAAGTGDALTAMREGAIAKGTPTGTFDR
jgi:phosphatidylethanolamine-binding protein (PEBP) family uncharacterized protein